jgi:uncharacterized membrane protein
MTRKRARLRFLRSKTPITQIRLSRAATTVSHTFSGKVVAATGRTAMIGVPTGEQASALGCWTSTRVTMTAYETLEALEAEYEPLPATLICDHGQRRAANTIISNSRARC